MFEHSLIDLESKQQPRTRRWISLPVAVALHLVALTAFAFGSYWTVGTVAEPNLATAFIDLQLPPLPPPPAGGHPQRPRTPQAPPTRPAAATTAIEQPHAVPDRLPDPGPAQTVTDLPPGPPVVGTDFRTGPIGTGDGADNGPTFDPGPRGEEGPIRLTAEMSRPRPLQPILPKYTEIARRAGLQGSVIVQAVIDEHGRATDVRILRGLPMGLDRAAVEAIERCPFEPARIGSRAVKVYFNLTVNFTIQR
jgi:periplasmic protein TonB